jgi:manganese oxidase
MRNRRDFFARIGSLGAAAWAGKNLKAAPQGRPAENIPVETPDLPKLPFKLVDGVKEFHLIAEVVRTEFVPGRVVDAWGFNGSVPGPTLEVNQGDRVRVVFENRLPEMTAVHWHGFEVPMEMDGSVGLGQDPVMPGGKFVYEFTLNQAGTFFYHSHFAMQEMMGMIGLFIMHPKKPFEPRVDRDFGLILQGWDLRPHNTVPNTLAMEFNWLTFNGKSGPNCTPMLAKQGERVRIRMINMGMDHHPIHLHGNTFVVTGSEGGRGPLNGWTDQNTVLVGVAQARDIEFDAKFVGDWMLHCHLPHHMMNQMVAMVGPVEQAHQAAGAGHGGHAAHGEGGGEMYPKDDPEKKKIPGYPQDMWMPLDHLVTPKPENHGLRSGWTGAMMGMMTIVRVLTPQKYDEIMALKQKGAAAHEHHHPQQKDGAR